MLPDERRRAADPDERVARESNVTNSPIVSVVIPTYNYGHFVVAAVESVLAQTYADFELIVIDDGSTDDTRSRLLPFNSRIRYIHQENCGLSAARNRGIFEARGQFIGLLDADDQWHPQFLEILLPYFDRNPELVLVGSASRWSTERSFEPVAPGTLPLRGIPVDRFLTTHPISPSAVLIRRRIFDTVGLFDTSLRSVEDRDMWIRISLAGRAGLVDRRLTWTRIHATSMSSPGNTSRMEHFDRLVLQRAFADRRLARRLALRRKAYSIAAWRAAVGYREAGMYGQAWRCVAAAMLNWPLPYGKAIDSWPLGNRFRFIGRLLDFQGRSLFARRDSRTTTG
jgi:glycosyltransferase involved in cell wall biosynthesis